MNSLTWLILLIGLTDNLHAALPAIFIFGGLAAIACGVGASADDRNFDEARPHFLKWAKRLAGIVVFSIVLQIVIPTKQTMIMVAASEVGDKVVKSEKMQQILDPSIDLLQQWIKNELAVQKKKAE